MRSNRGKQPDESIKQGYSATVSTPCASMKQPEEVTARLQGLPWLSGREGKGVGEARVEKVETCSPAIRTEGDGADLASDGLATQRACAAVAACATSKSDGLKT